MIAEMTGVTEQKQIAPSFLPTIMAMSLWVLILTLWAPESLADDALAAEAGASKVSRNIETSRRGRWLLGRFAGRRRRRFNSSHQEMSAEIPWRSLFDGKSLNGWSVAQFGGEGEVVVQRGSVVLEMGEMLTGITFQGPLPKTNYEISLEAMRIEGIDFFCGLTFPVTQSSETQPSVTQSHCSLIVGGWAGAVVGLSSIDRRDASENETTRYMSFKTGQWYRIRVRVTPEKIEAWIDNEKVVDQNIVGRRISTRNEVDLSKPLGITAWQTRAALRDIKLRELPAQK